jgi:MarR family transcriptional regulator, multiple antibiotic resistance protein MarR
VSHQIATPHMSRRAATKPEPQLQEELLSVGYLLGRARASLLSQLDAELEPFGLGGMQFAVLKYLTQGAARTAADLCRLMSYDTGAMTRILDRLEQTGLVRRERCREDRRVVFLRVSAAGRALLPRLMVVGERVLEAHLAGFTHTEIGALKAYLGRMIDNGQTQRDNQRPSSGGNS